MTDKQFRKQRKRVQRHFRVWRERLRLTGWEFGFNYHRGPYEVNGATNQRCMASAAVDWEYRAATLDFNLAEIARASEREVENCVVHELCHVLVREMRQWATADDGLAHEERVCTEVAWAFLGMKG